MAATLAALADPTRRQMIEALRAGEARAFDAPRGAALRQVYAATFQNSHQPCC